MTPVETLLAFTTTAALLTMTPGLDTALVLRTVTIEGGRKAAGAAGGILVGCLIWGVAASLGAAGLLAASKLAFTALKWAGAAYLVWMGLKLIRSPRTAFVAASLKSAEGATGWIWFRRGVLTNLLNPKVGVFYISLLPQFVPDSVPAAGWMLMLCLIHWMLGVLWFTALIAAGQPLGRMLKKPVFLRVLDRITGGIFIAFGAKLALGDE